MSDNSVGVSSGAQAPHQQSLGDSVETFAAWLGTLGYEPWASLRQ